MDPEQIRPLLEGLEYERSLFFCMLCCERLYPNYEYFHEKTQWGDIKPLRNGLEFIDKNFSKEVNKSDVKKLMESIEKVTPDTENFPSIFGSFALDACAALLESLNYTLAEDVDKVIAVASSALDTVYMFKQELDNSALIKLENQPFINSDNYLSLEANRQLNQLTILKENFNSRIKADLKASNLKHPIIDIILLCDT